MRDSADLFGAYSEVIDPIVKNLERITAPTLVIWGENDKVIPSRLSAVAMAGIVRSELMLIEKCGHLPTLEHPGKVLNGIAEFLNKHPNLQGTV
ncbi:MAG: alpha/beta fold hydrolase [Chitinispirillaceae bacterium]